MRAGGADRIVVQTLGLGYVRLSTSLGLDYETPRRRWVQKMLKILARLPCLLGFHDFRIVEKVVSFGSGNVEKVQCRRCGLTVTRHG